MAGLAIAAMTAVVELLGSWASGSLALLSDAGHVGTDAVAFALSLGALRVSARPHTPRMSFGYHRTEVLAAVLNALLLLGIAGFLISRAYERYVEPPRVEGTLMLLVGGVGLAANLVMLGLLRDWARRNINVRGAFLHAYGDTLGSVGVVAGAALIAVTDLFLIDVVIAVFIVALILVSAARLLRDCVHILLEASPPELSPKEVAEAIQEVQGVRGVHDLHVWTVTSGLYAVTGHISVSGDLPVSEAARIVDRVEARLRERFGIAHATFQVDSLEEEMIPATDVLRESRR